MHYNLKGPKKGIKWDTIYTVKTEQALGVFTSVTAIRCLAIVDMSESLIPIDNTDKNVSL